MALVAQLPAMPRLTSPQNFEVNVLNMGFHEDEDVGSLIKEFAQLSISSSTAEETEGIPTLEVDTAAVTKIYKNAERIIKQWIISQPHLKHWNFNENMVKRTGIESAINTFRGRFIQIPEAIRQAFEDSLYYRNVLICHYSEKYKDDPEANEERKQGHVFFYNSVKQWDRDLVSYATPFSGIPAPTLLPPPFSRPIPRLASPSPSSGSSSSSDDDVSALIAQCKKEWKGAIGTKHQARERLQQTSTPEQVQGQMTGYYYPSQYPQAPFITSQYYSSQSNGLMSYH